MAAKFIVVVHRTGEPDDWVREVQALLRKGGPKQTFAPLCVDVAAAGGAPLDVEALRQHCRRTGSRGG